MLVLPKINFVWFYTSYFFTKVCSSDVTGRFRQQKVILQVMKSKKCNEIATVTLVHILPRVSGYHIAKNVS